MDDEKMSRVIELFKAHANPLVERAELTQSIVGSGNIQVGGDLHVKVERLVTRPRVVLTPGDGVIDESQAARLKALLTDWVNTNNAVRRTQLSFAAAWSALNKRAGVTSYRAIPSEKFASLEKWLQQQSARIGNMASAPRKDGDWRAKKIGAIKARCKNQLGDEYAYRPYIQRNFKADSLSELATADLQRVYAYVMAKKAP